MSIKNIALTSGLIGVCIGACAATIAAVKYCEKKVDECVNDKIADKVMDNVNLKEIEKDVKKQATEKVADKIEIVDEKVDKKLKNFNERLAVMEDIDAKKLEVSKAAIFAIVTVSTTLIKSYYDNKKSDCIDYAVSKTFEHLDDVLSNNFALIESRLQKLEVK